MIESLLRNYIRALIMESTPRIKDLHTDDIINLLEDILGRKPFLSFTEKLAGQFFEVKIENGLVTANYKETIEKGIPHSPTADLGGVARVIKNSRFAKSKDAKFKFEVIKPENRPDYIDYAIGDIPVAIEFTGAMSKALCVHLNEKQNFVKFLCKEDITKRPKPLRPELQEKLENIYNLLVSNPKISRLKKIEIENFVSESFIEIFGESVFGGTPEGVFATGASKDFKIPNLAYANIQRIQAPVYAIFSQKSQYTNDQIIERIEGLVNNPDKLKTDKMLIDLHKYLEAASQGFSKGFRTFFSQKEASLLLSNMEEIMGGADHLVYDFYDKINRRINNKRAWVST
jgi:hypothetical protein